MEKEIYDIPIQARLCYDKNKGLILPDKVPYIGMGSSYYAAVTLRFLGVKIFPELASEYFYYLKGIKQFDNAVLISQSGRTTDIINCSSCFKEYTAIVNEINSPLADQPNLKLLVPIFAGEEKFSSTKSFFNTLITLYLGHGYDIKNTLDSIERRFSEFELTGNSIGADLFKSINKKKIKCFILGNGPNFGTACHASLLLSESTKFPFVGMSLTQYEHGYKETAEGAVIIVINPSKGKLFERTSKLMNVLRNVNAKVFEINDSELDEIYSPFSSILPFFFMASLLASSLGVVEPFQIGNKITEWKDETNRLAE
jgi:glutamine---fructose-6-phosphate transaminase (isomerizing)